MKKWKDLEQTQEKAVQALIAVHTKMDIELLMFSVFIMLLCNNFYDGLHPWAKNSRSLPEQMLEDKSGAIPCFSSNPQIPWKDQTQQCVRLSLDA